MSTVEKSDGHRIRASWCSLANTFIALLTISVPRSSHASDFPIRHAHAERQTEYNPLRALNVPDEGKDKADFRVEISAFDVILSPTEDRLSNDEVEIVRDAVKDVIKNFMEGLNIEGDTAFAYITLVGVEYTWFHVQDSDKRRASLKDDSHLFTLGAHRRVSISKSYSVFAFESGEATFRVPSGSSLPTQSQLDIYVSNAILSGLVDKLHAEHHFDFSGISYGFVAPDDFFKGIATSNSQVEEGRADTLENGATKSDNGANVKAGDSGGGADGERTYGHNIFNHRERQSSTVENSQVKSAPLIIGLVSALVILAVSVLFFAKRRHKNATHIPELPTRDDNAGTALDRSSANEEEKRLALTVTKKNIEATAVDASGCSSTGDSEVSKLASKTLMQDPVSRVSKAPENAKSQDINAYWLDRDSTMSTVTSTDDDVNIVNSGSFEGSFEHDACIGNAESFESYMYSSASSYSLRKDMLGMHRYGRDASLWEGKIQRQLGYSGKLTVTDH